MIQKYNVTLSHIVGYWPEDENGEIEPKLKLSEYIVEAESENEAIKKANDLDNTKWSVYESYADLADEN